jgi:hypothetical protein
MDGTVETIQPGTALDLCERPPSASAMVTEADVRHSLRVEVLAGAAPSAEAVFEFWVPLSNERADVAVIGTTMDGFEIKTERDTLKRLPRQASAYTRVFDRCHIVLAHRHVDGALEIVPPWWGVQVIDDGLTFVTLREAEHNRNVDPETLVRLLWRDEAYVALCELGTVPEPRTSRFRLWEMLLALLDVDSLRRVVRETLLSRDAGQARIPSRRFGVA